MKIIIIIIFCYLESAVQGLWVSENTLSVQRPQPHTTNKWKEEEDKIVGDLVVGIVDNIIKWIILAVFISALLNSENNDLIKKKFKERETFIKHIFVSS